MKRPSYSAVVSTLALVIAVAALCVGGAVASGVIVTSKQIKNGSILTQDLHKSAVKGKDIAASTVQSSDIGAGQVDAPDIGAGQVGTDAIANGQVSSADIGNGQVTPEDVNLPDPGQLRESDTSVMPAPTLEFARIDDVGAYLKTDPTSVLEVDWTGSVRGENGGEASGCVFQLRVDGLPAPGNAGEIFAKGLTSVSGSALFSGLPVGAHEIEVWARITINTSMGNSCTVGPAAAGIGQTFVVSEQVT